MKYAQLILAGVIFCMVAFGRFGGAGAASGVGREMRAAVVERSDGMDRDLKVKVGQAGVVKQGVILPGTEAELAVWILTPAKGQEVKGTILFLHGFMAAHYQLENAAEALRREGYRSVLVDLRGFGESTGDRITFGALDAQDMKQLVDALQRRGLCGKTVGVYGTSYGAASAILYAGVDPRVTTVVAVAPFAAIRDEVPTFARHALRGVGAGLTDSDLNIVADVVSRFAHFDLDAARPIEAITKTAAHILLIHGDADTVIPHKASELLHAADAERSRLLTVAGRGHLDLCFDIRGELQKPAREWFDRYLGG